MAELKIVVDGILNEEKLSPIIHLAVLQNCLLISCIICVRTCCYQILLFFLSFLTG